MINVNRRAGIKAMRKFLKQEEVKGRDIRRFARLKHTDGAVTLVAVLKDGRTCAIEWKP